jgi:hypothetical protein
MFGNSDLFGQYGPLYRWPPAPPLSHGTPWEAQPSVTQHSGRRVPRDRCAIPLKNLKIGAGGWVDGQALRVDAEGQLWVNPSALANGTYHEIYANIYLQRDENAWLADVRGLPSRMGDWIRNAQPGPISRWEASDLEHDRDAFPQPAASKSSGDWCEPVLRVVF